MLDPHLHYQKKKKGCTFKFAICTEVQNNVTSITFHVESSFTLSEKIVLRIFYLLKLKVHISLSKLRICLRIKSNTLEKER